MSDPIPLWPTRLHHLRLDSADPERLARFYQEGLGLDVRRHDEDQWLVEGSERRLVLGRGTPRHLAYAAFDVGDAARLGRIGEALAAHGTPRTASPSPLFGEEALAVTDPDGRLVVLGVPRRPAAGSDRLPARLQHVVVASSGLPAMTAFYRDALGFVVSDRVLDARGEVTACFLRSDPEHHSFAVFRAPSSRLDHHCYETTCWNDLRDWADHLASRRVSLWWGPGRHGPGNNLFFMVTDPDGNNLEFSAELEHMPRDMAAREWPHEERTLNLWGQAWMRS